MIRKFHAPKAAALIFTLSVLSSHSSFAQFDDEMIPPPMPSDFNSPPIPPPSNFGDSSSSGMETFSNSRNSPINTSGTSNPAGLNVPSDKMSESQKKRFSKANIEDITNENFPETIESFDFPNAEITDIVKAISELTGKNFIIDPGVRGKITIIAPSKITVAEAYKAFLSSLAINGYAVVPSQGFYKIRSARNAQRDSIETFSGAYYPNSDQMITRIIHLKHISAEAVNRDLRMLVSKDGELNFYNQTNSLIISDFGSNIDRVMKIIAQLDMPGFDEQLEVLPVKFAKAKDIADLIDRILNRGQKGGAAGAANQGGFNAGVPRFNRGSSSPQGQASFLVIPDDRTNSLIVTGNKAGIARIRSLLSQLDFRLRPEDAGGVYVYYVRNGDAEKIATTLSGIAKSAAPSGGGASATPAITPQGVQPPQEIFGGDVKITADKSTNSLVVVASKQDYEVVLGLLNKIDIPRDQVYVETIIMEMRSSDASKYEVGVLGFNESGASNGFNGRSSSNLADLFNPVSPQAGLSLGTAGQIITVTPPGGAAIKMPSTAAFLNFLQSTTGVNILSTPQITATDNQEASILVGDKVVVGATAIPGTAGAQPTVTPQFGDADIELKLKPFISPTTDSVRLEIEARVAQISTASTPKAFQDSTTPLARRQVKTNITVKNGDTAMIGGLMKDDEREIISKVPLLGDIPVLGWLFKSRSLTKDKTNMMIFLTPKIMRSGDDQQKLLSEKVDQRLEYLKEAGGRDPYGATIDRVMKRQARNPNSETQSGKNK